jgi:hypothetical protein
MVADLNSLLTANPLKLNQLGCVFPAEAELISERDIFSNSLAANSHFTQFC